ncbi:hypothetical protein [Saccharomonospora piscinae]|uniref:hypothetical protein n=1 Tax=Saccharomonospora piscinae TaxID=687388 RepID=UPI001FC8F9BC|nr:hypothetical protein [Saccharomonospora piscinae]
MSETEEQAQMAPSEDSTPDSDDRDRDDRGERSVVVVGLLCDPGLPSDTVAKFVDDFRQELSSHITDEVDWEVRTRTEPVELDENGQVPIIQLAEHMRPQLGWDLLVCVTDLPRSLGSQPVVADMSVRHGVALASLPALGAVALRRRLRDTLLYLVGELGRAEALGYRAGRDRRRAGGRSAPVRWMDNPDAEIEVSLSLIGWRGRLRLLAGMVRDNKPWRLVPELSTALAAGFAAAAFGIFYSSIWLLADALSVTRLVVINVLAVVAMIVWLIGYNKLWEPRSSSPKEKALLYNMATVASMAVGVTASYVVLFAVTLAGAVAVIESGYLAQSLGHSSGVSDYLQLAWLSSSMGTVAGALGSSLESEDAVMRAAYSKRERERRRLAKESGDDSSESDGR